VIDGILKEFFDVVGQHGRDFVVFNTPMEDRQIETFNAKLEAMDMSILMVVYDPVVEDAILKIEAVIEMEEKGEAFKKLNSKHRFILSEYLCGKQKKLFKNLEYRFNKAMKIAISNFYHARRMERVIHCLQNGSPIDDVYCKFLFYDDKDFSKQFRKAMGVAPGKFSEIMNKWSLILKFSYWHNKRSRKNK
jgi:AraC-like DNA-binding protein